MRKTNLKEYHHARYISLLLTGELWTYLANLNEQAEERMDTIVRQMMETEGVTEELKAHEQMEWIRKIQKFGFYAELTASATVQRKLY